MTLAYAPTGRRRIAMRLVKQRQRIHEHARARRALLHTSPVGWDQANDCMVYLNTGRPVGKDDPRYGRKLVQWRL